MEELQRQRETVIKKENKYCELRIIIGKDDTCPYAHFESRNVTSFEHALMLKCMEEVMAGLVQRDTVAYEIYKNMKIQVNHIEQDIKKSENKEAFFNKNENHIPRID